MLEVQRIKACYGHADKPPFAAYKQSGGCCSAALLLHCPLALHARALPAVLT
jgi:hypothetical protein